MLKFKSGGQENSVAGNRIKDVRKATFGKEHHELSLTYLKNIQGFLISTIRWAQERDGIWKRRFMKY